MIDDQYMYGGTCTDYFTSNRFDEADKKKYTIKSPSEVTCVKEAFAGDKVAIEVKLSKTKKLDDVTICYGDTTASIVKDMEFTMPNCDVEIKLSVSTVSTKTKTVE